MAWVDSKEAKLKKKTYMEKYYQRNKEKINSYSRKYRKERREELFKQAIEGCGGKCLFCGEDRPEGLLFHHVYGEGRKHREKLGGEIYMLYKWIIDNNFPNDIILLCGTCHLILHRTINT